MSRVLMIGGHGTLGRPVARRLLAEGFQVRVLARNPDKAWELLPREIEVVPGDLRDPKSIARAADECGFVHLSLATSNPKAEFRTELDGTRAVIYALRDRLDIVLSKVSALGARNTRGWWLDEEQKYEAEHTLMASRHPFVIWRPTWVMESLPMFMKKDRFYLFVKDSPPLFWIAGDDFGKWIARAFKDASIRNRIFNVQGPEGVGFRAAAERFIQAYDPAIHLRRVPLGILRLLGLFRIETREFARLLISTKRDTYRNISSETWDVLGKPSMTIEDYVNYMRTTGDIPKRP